MRIIITAKNLELTGEFEAFINEKIGGLEKFLSFIEENNNFKKGKNFLEFFVELEKETKHHKKGPIFQVKTKINLPGKTLVASSKNDDLSKALIEVKDEMQQELKKYKAKKSEISIRKERKNRNEA
ncbi:MAG: ribosome-associated translation inhibitor RaiA [Candidatus Staskawiczbacteria bacterium]|nr:ribosome-associated translation inhibitor RaiA [Candidatus Staskawiczbacteria bacterium]